MRNKGTQLLHGCRVLIVEDEYFLADDLAKIIKAHGGEIIGPVGELADAVQALESTVDVAILDINLHEEMSYSVADELRGRGTPFLLATGYSTEVIPERFRNVQIREKPFEAEEIVADLVRLCRSAALP